MGEFAVTGGRNAHGQQHFECVLFDLGGLLVDFRGVDAIGGWLGQRDSRALWSRWLSSTAVRAFERGQHDADAFARGLIADFDLELEPEDVLTEIAGWISGPTAGALELLDELRALGPSRPRIACLSNTNPMHWPRLERSLGGRFDHLFLSHQTGRLKPDPDAFDQVPERLAVAAGRVLFFDDQPVNVEAARARGLSAEQTVSPAECRQALIARGLLAVSSAAAPTTRARPGSANADFSVTVLPPGATR